MTISCALLLASALGGCFSEPSSSSDGDDDESDVGSSDTSSASSTSTSSASGSSSSTTTASSSGGTGETSTGTTADDVIPEPRAIWRFDGDMVEDIGSADATAIGNVSFVESPSSMAAVIAASSSYIDASTAGSIVLEHKDALTILMQLRLDDHSGNQMLWSLGPASHMASERNAMSLSVLDGVFHFFTETGAAEVHGINPVSAPPPGQWFELVVVLDAGFVSIFFDRELAVTSPFVPVETSTTEFYIGGLLNTADPAQSIPLHGAIDEVRIWDVALDDDAVVAISEG